MPLTAGTKLGPYEVLSPLGAGGMGEVYRARDPRLQRDVAIKVLPAFVSRDPDRLRRFEHEARATGALNHPNILVVFDVGTYEGVPYLVTELLEGSPLRARLLAGAIPARKATEYGVQIAHGLAAAHEKGIVHRDLKPENIFICRDGRAKILDFGLAKLTATDSSDATVTNFAAIDHTGSGVVLGTAGYMSPEQVRGERADSRSDIFSFGAVLYEALTGQRAFTGASAADRASAILKEDPPDLRSSSPSISPALARVVHRCLEKNPQERFESARDLAFHLETVSTDSYSDSFKASAPALPRRSFAIWLTAAVAVIAVLAAGWLYRDRVESIKSRPVTFIRLTDFAGLEETPAFSPDGKSVVFVSDSTGSRQIFVRLLAGGPPLQITHDPGAHLEPRWSQDSASILYFTPPPEGDAQGTIWEVSALGGPARRLESGLSGVDVSHDGKHLTFFRLGDRQMQLVASDRDGSNARVVMQAPVSFSYRKPRWSPDDRLIAFLHSRENWADDVYVVRADGGPAKQISDDNTLMSGLAWLSDGSILYSSARGSTVLYLPTMHLWRISESGGPPQQVTFGESGDESPDVDRDGRIVVSRRHMQFDIWKFPTEGDPAENVRRAVRITHQTGQVQTPTLSPDDRKMAYLSDNGGHGNLWIMDLTTNETRQITFEKSPGKIMGVPIWSPDGNYITFATNRPELMGRGVGYSLVHPDGSGLRPFISEGAWAAWSGDGKWLYYADSSPLRPTGGFRLLKSRLDGGPQAVVRSDNARGPALAPDGSALYYTVPLENLNGLLDYELRVARPEDGPSTLLARVSGVRIPIWQGFHPVISRDGKSLAMALDDDFGTDLWTIPTAGGKLQRITDFSPRRTFIARRISWSADGKWIFAAVGEGDSDIVQIDGLLH